MPHSHKLKTLTAGFERLDQVATRLEIASDRLEESIEDIGGYPDTYPETYGEWSAKQSEVWYSSDRIRDHVAELRRVLRRIQKIRGRANRALADAS
jgi:hypothetical protein